MLQQWLVFLMKHSRFSLKSIASGWNRLLLAEIIGLLLKGAMSSRAWRDVHSADVVCRFRPRDSIALHRDSTGNISGAAGIGLLPVHPRIIQIDCNLAFMVDQFQDAFVVFRITKQFVPFITMRYIQVHETEKDNDMSSSAGLYLHGNINKRACSQRVLIIFSKRRSLCLQMLATT